MKLRSDFYRKKAGRFFAVLALCLLTVLLLLGSGGKNKPVSRSGFYFDTAVTLTGYGRDAGRVLEEGMALCQYYEDLLSRTREGSDIWNINHAGGQPVKVQKETASLIRQALDWAEQTDGLIDPTIAPLADLWNFTGSPAGPVPSDFAIQELLCHVDYTAVLVEGDTVRLKDPKAQLDLGFIAKGYIADRLKELFLREGLTSALIDLGGNILAVGSKPGTEGFSVGIRRPFKERYDTLMVLSLNDRSLVSSGTYERGFEEDGVWYHHILNPFTGRPADTRLTQVTILSDSSVRGDALSTACFLLGADRGTALIESLPDTEALFVFEDGSVLKTDGFP